MHQHMEWARGSRRASLPPLQQSALLVAYSRSEDGNPFKYWYCRTSIGIGRIIQFMLIRFGHTALDVVSVILPPPRIRPA